MLLKQLPNTIFVFYFWIQFNFSLFWNLQIFFKKYLREIFRKIKIGRCVKWWLKKQKWRTSMCLGKDMNMKNASVVPVLTRGRDPERTIKWYPPHTDTHRHRHLSLYQVGREKKKKRIAQSSQLRRDRIRMVRNSHWGHSLLRFFSFLLHNHTNVFVVFLNLFSAFIWWAIWISSFELPSYWVESTNFMISTTNLLSVLFYQKILYFKKTIMVNFI